MLIEGSSGKRPQTTKADAKCAGLVAEQVQHVYGNFVVMDMRKTYQVNLLAFREGLELVSNLPLKTLHGL